MGMNDGIGYNRVHGDSADQNLAMPDLRLHLTEDASQGLIVPETRECNYQFRHKPDVPVL
jgi:hypothetical protein